MSGIFGLFHKQGAPADPGQLRAMQDAMAAWGRGAGGFVTMGAVGLGHVLQDCRGASEAERQPCSDPDAPHLTITADADLDNRDELRAMLSLDAREGGALPDGALILRAFRRWGRDCAARLSGAFAFAIWDERSRQLYCARDHMGFRPFHYFDAGAHFVFASDVTAVLAAPFVPRRLDDRMLLADELLHFRMQKDRSFFQDVAKLPAAHWMTVAARATQRGQWWRPAGDSPIRLRDNDAYAEALREQLDRAVARALRGDARPGAHLSGGLDSTAVCVLAARRLRAEAKPRLKAYCWAPPPDVGDPERDERALVRLICEREGLTCDFTRPTPDDMCDYMSRDVSVLPTNTMFHEIKVCAAAAAEGVGVMLSGWGGDEFAAFNGRGFFAEKLARLELRTLAREARLRTTLHGEALGSFLLGRACLPLVPDWALSLARRDMSGTARSLTRGGAVRLDDLVPGVGRMMREKWSSERERRGVRRMQRRLYENGHLTARIEAWAHLGACHGVTYRYPLLDRRLIEFCMNLPPEMYFQQGWKRFLFRYAADFLPDAVRWSTSKRDPALIDYMDEIRHEGINLFLRRWRQEERVPETVRRTIRRHDVLERLRRTGV